MGQILVIIEPCVKKCIQNIVHTKKANTHLYNSFSYISKNKQTKHNGKGTKSKGKIKLGKTHHAYTGQTFIAPWTANTSFPLVPL